MSTLLIDAVVKGDFEEVQTLLKEGADANEFDSWCHQKTPLMYASELKRCEIAQVLIEHGADVNLESNHIPSTALAVGIKNLKFHSKLSIIKLLLDNGANSNVFDADGMSALMYACQKSSPDKLIQLLIGNRAIVDLCNLWDEEAYSPLMYAIQQKKEKAILALIKNGADINKATNWGVSPLELAFGEDESLALLLLRTMNNDTDDEDMSPLVYATIKGQKNAVDSLLSCYPQHGDRKKEENDFNNALVEAAYAGHTEIVQLLLENGADVNTADGDGNTSLIQAAYAGHIGIVHCLVENGADIDATDKNGDTALMWAAHKSRLPVVEFLVSKGASVDIQSEGKKTALHEAVLVGSSVDILEIIKILLEHGANIWLPCEGENTILDYAKKNSNSRIVDLLNFYAIK